MIVVDSGVLVAASAPWHEAHTAARAAALVGETFPRQRIVGGATYDALIAATAAAHGATLLTLDRRARVTYDRVGCRNELLTR